MVGLSRIQMAPFGIQPLFDHLNTRLVQYSDRPLYLLHSISGPRVSVLSEATIKRWQSIGKVFVFKKFFSVKADGYPGSLSRFIFTNNFLFTDNETSHIRELSARYSYFPPIHIDRFLVQNHLKTLDLIFTCLNQPEIQTVGICVPPVPCIVATQSPYASGNADNKV